MCVWEYCRGSAQSILRTVEDCRRLVAWQKLHRVYNPMTVARTIQALGEVTRPPCVTDISLAEGAISKWEEMLKKVERELRGPHEDRNIGQLHALGDQGVHLRQRAA